MNLSDIKTFVYIDASNIRSACVRSCNFRLDFIKLLSYLKNKYPNLVEARYYEGIACGDEKKAKYFEALKRVGYQVCQLERREYIDSPRYAKFKCSSCLQENVVQVFPASRKLKSNVDVYLASDMLECAAKTPDKIHIILISCDGDYAEAINSIMRINPTAFVTIVATPMTKKNNCLSARLRVFADRSYQHTTLMNIDTIRDYIS